MNKWIGIGRLTEKPDMKDANGTAVARYTLAVGGSKDRVDFIPCVAFGKSAEFAEKHFYKGIKIAVTGRIQTGSYTKKDGSKAYTTDIIVDTQEFVEPKQQEVPDEIPDFPFS